MDDLLGRSIEAFLVESAVSSKLVWKGALRPFHARIQMCLALGLIDQQLHEELLILKDVRNAFAHGLGVTLDHEDISRNIARMVQRYGIASESDPRLRLINHTVLVINALTGAAVSGAWSRLQASWPGLSRPTSSKRQKGEDAEYQFATTAILKGEKSTDA